MKLTPQNIIHHELIGLDAKIAESTNTSLIGIEGRVVDETKKLLLIETNDQERKIPKSCSTFLFTIPSPAGRRYLPVQVKVDGRLLLSQPENRILTRFKKKFRK